ncbi:dNMP kinase [Bacillus phage Eldridge]|uniref:DNMP kinase n=1 Tax=Bacillus phage Eldridge TaxID=1776293 RepID=A0A120HUN2_9CAUD|nr:dNMP kinase [Bacillus phage Eldridge]AMB18609.1 dNMP kinase [Bacillus phage Eldridge]
MKELKIALVGFLRSGKTTVQNHLVDKYHMTAFAFGDKLKEDFHRDHPEVPRVPKPVSHYQAYGQGKRETEYPEIWIDKCLAEVDRIRTAAANYNITGSEDPFTPLITDVRQRNEYERLLEEGYIIIRVTAPLETRKQRAIDAGDDISDKNFDYEAANHDVDFDVDYDIVNDGTLEELLWEVDMVMTAIKEKVPFLEKSVDKL